MKTLKALCIEYGVSQASLHRLTGIPYELIGLYYNFHKPTPLYIINMVEKMLELKQAAEKEDMQTIKRLLLLE